MRSLLFIFLFIYCVGIKAQESSVFSLFGPPGALVYSSVKDALKNPEQVYKFDFTEQIPDKHFAKLPKLANVQVVQIRNNGFNELPLEFTALSNLLYFSTKSNELKKLPKEIGNWYLMMNLELYDTALDSLPDEMKMLSKLKSLQIQNNKYDSLHLPATLFHLTTLNDVFIYNSPLAEVKVEDIQCKNLKRLTFWKCNLKAFPVQICKLKQLEILNLDDNQMVKVPKHLTRMRNLRYLSLKNNNISELPENICNLTNLETLDLRGNPISAYDADIIKALLPKCRVILK